MATQMSDVDAGPYFEYLHREQIFMGLASAATFAAGGWLIQQTEWVVETHKLMPIAKGTTPFIAAASLMFALSGVLFVFQRSDLLQVNWDLATARAKGEDIKKVVHDADDWLTFLKYRLALTACLAAMVELVIAGVYMDAVSAGAAANGNMDLRELRWLWVVVPIVVGCGWGVFVATVFRVYRKKDEHPLSIVRRRLCAR